MQSLQAGVIAMDKAAFFATIRKSIFKGSMTASQVSGIEGILDACGPLAVTDDRHVAYILATPMIETGGTFIPVVENLNYSPEGLAKTFGKYFPGGLAAQYAHKPEAIANRAYANRMGNGDEASGDGWKYRGRGYCQITGHDNYARFGKLLNADFIGNPGLTTDPTHAAQIIVAGMRDGLFTGKKLVDFLNDRDTDYLGARRIINGLDRASYIAAFAKSFEEALRV